METGQASPFIPTTLGQEEVTGQLLSYPHLPSFWAQCQFLPISKPGFTALLVSL